MDKYFSPNLFSSALHGSFLLLLLYVYVDDSPPPSHSPRSHCQTLKFQQISLLYYSSINSAFKMKEKGTRLGPVLYCIIAQYLSQGASMTNT